MHPATSGPMSRGQHPTTGTLRRAATCASVATLVLVAACGGSGGGGQAPAGGGAAPPPPEVSVVTVAFQTAPLTAELPGRVEPVRVAQVRARVTGIVQKRLFNEGSQVKAGQALFQIDRAPYEAAVDSAKAALAKAQANLMQASATVTRYTPLRAANAVSQQDFVNAQAAQAQAEADVAAAKAALRTAELNLGYATVTAPISGRIGRALVTEGALVSQAEATQMALIQQIDPVYVNATQSVIEVDRLRQQVAGAGKAPAESATVRVVLDDGSELPQKGRLLFADLSVDPTTEQVTLRAEVPNPSGRLLPGMYVRARLVQGEIAGAVLLPQQAVTRTAQGDTVLVVGEGGKPGPRPVKVAGSAGKQWIVTQGLAAGDQVIVEGFQKMRPNAPVKPVPWTPARPASAAAMPASAATPAASAASR